MCCEFPCPGEDGEGGANTLENEKPIKIGLVEHMKAIGLCRNGGWDIGTSISSRFLMGL